MLLCCSVCCEEVVNPRLDSLPYHVYVRYNINLEEEPMTNHSDIIKQNLTNAVDYNARADKTQSMLDSYGPNADWAYSLKMDRKRAAKSRESARRFEIMDRLNLNHWTLVPQSERM